MTRWLSCSGEGGPTQGGSLPPDAVLNVAGLHLLWASLCCGLLCHCAIIMFAFMIVASVSVCVCMYRRRICVWRLVLLLCVVLPVFCFRFLGVQGVSIVCYNVFLRLVCLESVVFVVEWVCVWL